MAVNPKDIPAIVGEKRDEAEVTKYLDSLEKSATESREVFMSSRREAKVEEKK